IWKLVSAVEHELRDQRDLLSFVAGAHARGDDQKIVSSPYSAVRPAKARECCPLALGDVLGLRVFEVVGQVPNSRDLVGHVFGSDLLALFDTNRRADRLTKLKDKFSRGYRPRGKAMTRRHASVYSYNSAARKRDIQPRRSRPLDHRDVVPLVHDDGVVSERGRECCFSLGHISAIQFASSTSGRISE